MENLTIATASSDGELSFPTPGRVQFVAGSCLECEEKKQLQQNASMVDQLWGSKCNRYSVNKIRYDKRLYDAIEEWQNRNVETCINETMVNTALNDFNIVNQGVLTAIEMHGLQKDTGNSSSNINNNSAELAVNLSSSSVPSTSAKFITSSFESVSSPVVIRNVKDKHVSSRSVEETNHQLDNCSKNNNLQVEQPNLESSFLKKAVAAAIESKGLICSSHTRWTDSPIL